MLQSFLLYNIWEWESKKKTEKSKENWKILQKY